MKKLFIVTVLLSLFSSSLSTQWLPDVRLTNDPSFSNTNYNIPCISTIGDTLHVVWCDERDGNREIYYKRSTDAGVSWGADIRLTNNAGSSEYPSITVYGSVLHLVWFDLRDGNNEIYYKRSADGGMSWGTDVRLTNATNHSRWPSVAVSGSAVHIVWFDQRDGNQEIYYIRSADGGISWGTDVRLTNDPGGSGWSSVVASGSVVHVVWGDNRYGAEIFYKRSTDGGITWGSDTRLTNDPGFSAYSWVSLSGSDLHIVWMDTRNGNDEIYYKRSTDSGISWGADVRLTNNSAQSEWPSVYASGMIVHVVWYDQRDGNPEIYYKRSVDGGLNWGADTRLTNNSSNSYYSSVSVSGQKVHVVWQDFRDGNGEIYYKQKPIGNTLIAIDSVSPRNKVNVLLNSDLKAYFNQNMNASTMDSSNILFFGSMTGRKQGTFTYNSGEKSVTINPQYDFKYGELISTTLKSSIKTGTDNFITPFVWSFTTLTKPANMVLNQISSVGVGNSPVSPAAGDFDNDGDIDIAVTNNVAGTVSIVINNGNGSFAKLGTDISTGMARRLVTGDLDNDGDLDLAAGVSNLSAIVILKNNGSAVFTITSTVSGPYFNHDLTTADYNGDGSLDIAVSNWDANVITVLLNNSNGEFSLSSTVSTGNGVYCITSGDFNSDGFIDLAAPNYYDDNVSIYKNTGAGSFVLMSSTGVGSAPQGITEGDIDSDGDLDLAVTNYASASISVLKNNGSGTFINTSAFTTGLMPWGVRFADFDGDGDLDIVSTSEGGPSLFRNDGTGAFTVSASPSFEGSAYVSPADFNNDGLIDVAVVHSGTNTARVYLNLASPQLSAPANNSTGNLNILNFSWIKSLGASNHRFQLATDSLFSNIVVNDSTVPGTDSVKNISGLSPLTWYYWRLNSKSANGSSLWSDVWKFKTQGTPTQVVLNAPANNAINQPVNCSFVWHKAVDQVLSRNNNKGTGSDGPENVSKYWFELSTDSLFSNIINIDSTLSDTTNSVNGLINLINYFWRVRAKNETGWGAYSAWFKFTTIISAPLAPVLVSPPNNAAGQNLSLTLVWNKLPTAETYRVQVATDSLFTGLIVNDSTLTDSTWMISGLNPLTFYWWRVNAKNIGGTSVWSLAFKFKTIGVPTQVILFSPLNNATNQPVNLTCVWRKSTDLLAPWLNVKENRSDENESISNYWFDMVTDTATMANLLRDTTLTDSSKTVSSLNYLTSYFWRVKAKNQIGWGNYSQWFKFTTIPLPPALVNLTVIPGGFFNSGTNQLYMKDTIRVYLVDSVTCMPVDSSKGVVDSINFSMPLSFGNAQTGNYYMLVYHRNHLGVATRFKQSVVRGSTVSYDFTTDSAKAFGFNMVKVSTSPVRWGMIPGDANKDGFIDAIDQFTWVAQNGLDGYLAADFNGDGFVDAIDQAIWVTFNGLSSFLPCGYTLETGTMNLIQNAPNYDAKKGNKIMFEKKSQDNRIKNDNGK